MKFSVDAAELAAAVAYVAPTVMSNPPSPALAGILVEAGQTGDQASVTFQATDTVAHQGANVTLAACEPGRVVVSGRMLSEISKALPTGQLDVALVDAHLELSVKRSRYRVPAIGEPFPSVPAARGGVGHKVPAEVLLDLIGVVRHCANDRSLQAPGVMLDLSGTDITVTAMTNAVLSRAVASVESPGRLPDSMVCIVGIGALEAAVKGAGETVGLCSADGSLLVSGHGPDGGRGAWIKQFTASKATQAARWFEGIPTGKILVDSADLLAALRRIPLALQAGERDLPGATLSVTSGSDGAMLTLSGRNGSAVEQVEIIESHGRVDLLTADVTTTLLVEVLATCGKREVTIEFHERRLLVRDQHEDRQAAHVVMLRRGV